MARQRTGCIVKRNGRLYARVTYKDTAGKRRELLRRATNKTHANEIRRDLLRRLDDHGEKILDGDKMTFRQLACVYEERRLQPAKYHGGRKISGLRSFEAPRGYLRILVAQFGLRRIKQITHSDIEEFKKSRLNAPTPRGKERTIAAGNRELELLRSVLRFAVRQGWLARSPFEMGTSLISKADEIRRERTLSFPEEHRLLSACVGRRAHLRGLLLTAIDTAMRRGELFRLKWSDVDFADRLIRVRATTTKTMRERIVGMTQRLQLELERLFEASSKDPDSPVFGIRITIKTAFASACRKAGIEDFRFHDCRHTAITRMIQSGMPANLVMKVSGHTQPITFSRYVNVDEKAARDGAVALDHLYDAIPVTTTDLVH